MRIRKSNIFWGSLMILLGAFFLVIQFFPSLNNWTGSNWPIFIVGIGGVFLVAGIVMKAPTLAIPASIIGGIGGLMLWQNATGNWASWAYIWTLIPGFVGIGLMLSDLFSGNFRMSSGGPILIIISLVMFAFFGSFLGGPSEILRFWPVLLIVIGLWQLARGMFGKPKGVS